MFDWERNGRLKPCLICEDSGGDILQTVTSVKNVGEVLNARLTEFPVPGN